MYPAKSEDPDEKTLIRYVSRVYSVNEKGLLCK